MTSFSPLLPFFVVIVTVTCFPTISGSTTDLIYRTCDHEVRQNKNNETSQQLINKFLSQITTVFHPNQTYKNFTLISSTTGPAVKLYGLYQCRGDLIGSSYRMCRTCLAQAATLLRTNCPNQHDAAIQLEGCYVKYDFTYIFGVQDLQYILTECMSSIIWNGTDITVARDAVLGRMALHGEAYYRHARVKNVEGVAQCLHDLTPSQCQECLFESIRQLRTNECKPWSTKRSFYTSKCYAQFNVHESDKGGSGSKSKSKSNNSNTNSSYSSKLRVKHFLNNIF